MKVLLLENPSLQFPTPLDSRVNLEHLYAARPDLRLRFAVCSVLSLLAAIGSRPPQDKPKPGLP